MVQWCREEIGDDIDDNDDNDDDGGVRECGMQTAGERGDGGECPSWHSGEEGHGDAQLEVPWTS